MLARLHSEWDIYTTFWRAVLQCIPRAINVTSDMIILVHRINPKIISLFKMFLINIFQIHRIKTV